MLYVVHTACIPATKEGPWTEMFGATVVPLPRQQAHKLSPVSVMTVLMTNSLHTILKVAM